MNIKLFEDIRDNKVEETEILIESCVLNEFFIDPEITINKYGLNDQNAWSNPSILPCRLDRTWQNWFKRIELWGTVKILHVDPENKKRDYISKDAFMKRMGNAEVLKVYGKWEVQQVKVYKMEFWNKYFGMNGKEYKEIIQITVDLKKELRKGLHWFQWMP